MPTPIKKIKCTHNMIAKGTGEKDFTCVNCGAISNPPKGRRIKPPEKSAIPTKHYSLYNMINGVNSATFFILPMLGKHPDEYPRFRDCWIGEVKNSNENDQFGIPKKVNDISKKIISVYTRVGGGNRESYQGEIDKLRKIPEYIRDFDDDFDCTFATFEFYVPKKMKS